MKKIYTFLLASSLFIGATNAQVTISTAPDFTVTDLDGNSFNLYSVLNSGKHVVIDFFFTTCVPCQGAAPHFTQAFKNYGCNTGNVVFISIDQGNTNAQCQAYENTYSGTNPPPMVSGTQGGGNSVNSAYGPGAYPTMILIAPNKNIIQKDMWPINNAASFDPYLSAAGLSYATCATGMEEIASPFHFNLFPNPATSILNVESNNTATISSYVIYDFMGKEVLSQTGDQAVEKVSIDVSTLPIGFYFAKIKTSEGLLVKKFNKI